MSKDSAAQVELHQGYDVIRDEKMFRLDVSCQGQTFVFPFVEGLTQSQVVEGLRQLADMVEQCSPKQ